MIALPTIKPDAPVLMDGGEKKDVGGRPREVIDLDELTKLCALQCTQADIASWFGVSRPTIERRVAEDPEFREAMERGYARGRISLRRRQIQRAEAGGDVMLIWLGKQYLGQTDRVESRISGADGGPLTIEIVRVSVDGVNRQMKALGSAGEP